MVRVDRDLKRCYFYRLKFEGDVKKPEEHRSYSPEFPNSGIPRQDIIPYNPHYRSRAPRQITTRQSTRRISWSREADRVREISPISEAESEPTKILFPPLSKKSHSFTDEFKDPEEKYPLTVKKKKKKVKKAVPKKKPTWQPVAEFPIYVPPTTLKTKPVTKTPKRNDLIRQQQARHRRAQQLEQARKPKPTSNLRRVKSESNLKLPPKETLMKKADVGKTKHFNPPRWRHVGDRNRRQKGDKNIRAFASDHYF